MKKVCILLTQRMFDYRSSNPLHTFFVYLIVRDREKSSLVYDFGLFNFTHTTIYFTIIYYFYFPMFFLSVYWLYRLMGFILEDSYMYIAFINYFSSVTSLPGFLVSNLGVNVYNIFWSYLCPLITHSYTFGLERDFTGSRIPCRQFFTSVLQRCYTTVFSLVLFSTIQAFIFISISLYIYVI